MRYLVEKPFRGAGVDRERGEVVDTTGWRTTRQLVALKKLSPLPDGAEVVTCSCGRSWADAKRLEAHMAAARCSARKPQIEREANLNEEPVDPEHGPVRSAGGKADVPRSRRRDRNV
jgi:hypothetical protein